MTAPPPINHATRPPPTQSHSPEQAPITDGSRAINGTISSEVIYQSSGILRHGVQLDHLGSREQIGAPGERALIDGSRGLTLELGGAGVHLDGKGRQRIELLSRARAVAGERWIYKWKTHLPNLKPISSPRLPNYKFTHLVQLLTRQEGHGGFVFALTLAGGNVTVKTIYDNLEDATKRGKGVKSMREDDYRGKTWYHRCVVLWGPNGSIEYTVQQVLPTSSPPPPPALSFEVSGIEVPADGSLKTGLYRAFVPEGEAGPLCAWVGEFDFKKR